MTDLYDFQKLCGILTNMVIFDRNKTNNLKSMHQTWIQKNSQYIKEILK